MSCIRTVSFSRYGSLCRAIVRFPTGGTRLKQTRAFNVESSGALSTGNKKAERSIKGFEVWAIVQVQGMGGGGLPLLFTIMYEHPPPALSASMSQLPGEVEKVDAGTVDAIFVNETRSDPAGEESLLVGLGQSPQ